jgi:hypothetical protein
MQLARDMSPEEFRNNILGLAKTAKLFELPVIKQPVVIGVLMDRFFLELKELFPDVNVIRRSGVINAWRWPEFREAVDSLDRKKLIIAAMTDSMFAISSA